MLHSPLSLINPDVPIKLREFVRELFTKRAGLIFVSLVFFEAVVGEINNIRTSRSERIKRIGAAAR